MAWLAHPDLESQLERTVTSGVKAAFWFDPPPPGITGRREVILLPRQTPKPCTKCLVFLVFRAVNILICTEYKGSAKQILSGSEGIK